MNKENLEAFAREAAKTLKTEKDLNDFRTLLTKITIEAAHHRRVHAAVFAAPLIECSRALNTALVLGCRSLLVRVWPRSGCLNIKIFSCGSPTYRLRENSTFNLSYFSGGLSGFFSISLKCTTNFSLSTHTM